MNKSNKLWLAVAMDVTMIVLILVNINLIIFDSFFSIHVISGFFQYRLATKLANQGDFELFALLKRILGFSLPLFILGLGVALPRYIAISATKTIANTYFSAGLLILLTAFLGGVGVTGELAFK
mgnify:CR=1 FL=1